MSSRFINSLEYNKYQKFEVKYIKVYKEGSLGNSSTTFGVVCNSIEKDVWSLAKKVSKIVESHMNTPKKLMLVLSCYIRMCPELIDVVAISTLGDYPSNTIEKAIFIPQPHQQKNSRSFNC